jgi:cobalamin synthase
MQATVCQSPRDEMTAYFTALRNLELGQYGVIVIVFIVLLKDCSIASLAIKAVAIIGFIFIATKIGTELHNKSTRIGSYIMVAYELKALEEGNEDDDRFQYWILANRGSSFKGVVKSEKDSFGFRKNLAKYYFRQKSAMWFFAVLTVSMMIKVYLKTGQINPFDVVATILFVLLVPGCVWSIHKDEEEAEDYGKDQVRHWRDYCKDRKESDAHFLQELLGDDFKKA